MHVEVIFACFCFENPSAVAVLRAFLAAVCPDLQGFEDSIEAEYGEPRVMDIFRISCRAPHV